MASGPTPIPSVDYPIVLGESFFPNSDEKFFMFRCMLSVSYAFVIIVMVDDWKPASAEKDDGYIFKKTDEAVQLEYKNAKACLHLLN